MGVREKRQDPSTFYAEPEPINGTGKCISMTYIRMEHPIIAPIHQYSNKSTSMALFIVECAFGIVLLWVASRSGDTTPKGL